MTLDELIPLVARFLAAHGVPYFIFGGVGVSLWGEPRTTKDLDLVLCVAQGDTPSLVAGLNALGFGITKPLHRKLREGRIIQLPIDLTALDVKLCTTDHDRESLARARPAKLGDFELRVATPEDIILYKLQTWRRQDQADIENLLGNVKAMDVHYIKDRLAPLEKATGHPMRGRWKDARTALPPRARP